MGTGPADHEHRKPSLFRRRSTDDASAAEGSSGQDRQPDAELILNGRPSRIHVLMDTARLWAARSTCSRLHVGCVVARESRILTTGYNGTPAGMPHCNHDCDCGYPGEGGLLFSNKHLSNCASLQPCQTAVHAEANAITFAARYGLALEGAHLYTTHMPCLNCCMLIVNAGIAAVVWDIDYRDESGLKLLEGAGVGFGRYRSS